MRISVYCLCFWVVATSAVYAQSPYIPLNTDYYHLIDRLEIRRGSWADGFHSSVKPYNRHSVIELADSLLAEQTPTREFSDTDYFNFDYLHNDSWEWVPPGAPESSQPNAVVSDRIDRQPGDSREPVFGILYKKKADFYGWQTPDFDLHVNPVLYLGFGAQQFSTSNVEITNPNRLPYYNTRGFEMRGTIGGKVGFYTYFADNQAVYPTYVDLLGIRYLPKGHEAAYIPAPGEGFTKPFGKNGRDFLSARGYFTLNVLKIINLQFGHDRNFVGNGFRSLFLSDNSSPYLFLKLTTRFGKNIQYTNLFTELQNTQDKLPGQQLITQKFAAMHHLSINITPKINLGIFEADVFSRDRFDINYLNPIILYRYVESYRGSADNAMIGLDLKVNLLNHFLVYSQLLIDEFRLKALMAGTGDWTNKFGLQLGAKYIDAFNVPNLDLQAEVNAVRPYTYAHQNTQTSTVGQGNYIHYNQPLAHPLGANFIEALGIARYQRNKLSGTAILGIMRYGTDPPNRNYGGNIMLDYNTRVRDEGNFIGQGRETIVTYADLRASYMVKHNIFLEGRALYRFQDSQYNPDNNTTFLTSVALRWNIPYRNLVF